MYPLKCYLASTTMCFVYYKILFLPLKLQNVQRLTQLFILKYNLNSTM